MSYSDIGDYVIKTDNTQALYNALDRIKELEALAQKLVDALGTAGRYYKKNSRPPLPEYLVTALAEAAKLGIK